MLYTLSYMVTNYFIPEWEDDPYPLPEATVFNQIEDSVIMLIFIMIPVYGLYFSKYGLHQLRTSYEIKVNNANLREQVVRNELFFLKSKFMDHLTYNTLHHIQAEMSDNEEISKTVVLLGRILRYNASIDASQATEVSKEVQYIRDFIEIHKILTPKLCIEFDVHGDCSEQLVFPRVMIAMIENAVKHGVGNDPEFPIKAQLHCNGQLTFEVKNKKRKLASKISTNVGIKLLKQTISTFYGDECKLTIDENHSSYRICIKIKTTNKKALLASNYR